MFCIKCGQKIPDDSAFCQFCGSTLVPQAAEPVQPAAPVTVKKEKKQKFCKECGSPIDSESNKCTGCGKRYFKIKGKPKEKTKEKAEKKPFKFKWWYAAVAVAVLLVGYVAVNYIGAVSAMNNGKFVKSKQFFDNLVAKIRSIYKGQVPDSVEGRAVMEMTDSIERLQQLFAEALVDASENFRAAEKNTTNDGDAEM